MSIIDKMIYVLRLFFIIDFIVVKLVFKNEFFFLNVIWLGVVEREGRREIIFIRCIMC